MSVKDDIEIGLLLGAVIFVAVLVYYAKDLFSNLTCITKVGKIPGITGATEAQVNAAKNTANRLRPGGKTIWSCGSDYDYLQPCGAIVTEARHSFFGQVTGTPMTFTDVSICCYTAPCGAKPFTPTFSSGASGPVAPGNCCLTPCDLTAGG